MNFNKFNTVKTIYWELDTMVKCPRCGYENNDISVYCENCTYPIKNPQTANSDNKSDNGWNISTGKKNSYCFRNCGNSIIIIFIYL